MRNQRSAILLIGATLLAPVGAALVYVDIETRPATLIAEKMKSYPPPPADTKSYPAQPFPPVLRRELPPRAKHFPPSPDRYGPVPPLPQDPRYEIKPYWPNKNLRSAGVEDT